MYHNNLDFYVITGGPGAGKTTLLHQLKERGYTVMPEDARRIIKEQMAAKQDGLPWADKKRYGMLMLEAAVETYERAVASNQAPIFFDRGLLDVVCYMTMENIDVRPLMTTALSKCRYRQQVFILPPWKAIYHADSERKQNWEDAVYTFEQMSKTYQSFGYNLIEVPRVPVNQRAQFVLKAILQTLK
ncbi:AAA family ATPase [Niabella insulamsoli]|uniref:AAA family ATPase n=1 Tax=Niabella insulamsoli TaxID=3144874 RepID=UPI0031FC9E9D